MSLISLIECNDFDYTLFAVASALKRFNRGKEGHLARACPNRPGPATPAILPVPRPILAARHQWFSAAGGAADSDKVEMEPQVEEK